MEFGASIFLADYSITPAALALTMEERGFGSLWAAEHSHIPVPRRTPAPGRGELAAAGNIQQPGIGDCRQGAMRM
jgi:hypothetical protein